jgi:hypothetical protein
VLPSWNHDLIPFSHKKDAYRSEAVNVLFDTQRRYCNLRHLTDTTVLESYSLFRHRVQKWQPTTP